MRAKNLIHVFTYFAIFAVAATPVISAPMMVSVLPSGHLTTLSVLGGGTRKSTPVEIASWKAHAHFISTKSPDGRYEISVIKAKINDFDIPAFQVVKVSDRQIVLSASAIEQTISEGEDISSVDFHGWLPNSHSMNISTNEHISSDEFWKFGTINVDTRHLINFDGFITPNMKYAIVPGKADKLDEDFKHYEDEPGHQLRTTGSVCWYVVPISRNVTTNYRFTPAAAKPLLLTGKAFPFSYEIANMSDDNPLKQELILDFSTDGKWAVLHTVHWVSQLQRSVDVDYLIAMTTGAMRKLPGSHTHFL